MCVCCINGSSATRYARTFITIENIHKRITAGAQCVHSYPKRFTLTSPFVSMCMHGFSLSCSSFHLHSSHLLSFTFLEWFIPMSSVSGGLYLGGVHSLIAVCFVLRITTVRRNEMQSFDDVHSSELNSVSLFYIHRRCVLCCSCLFLHTSCILLLFSISFSLLRKRSYILH